MSPGAGSAPVSREQGAQSAELGAGSRGAYLHTAPDFTLALRGTSGERAGVRGAFALTASSPRPLLPPQEERESAG